MTENKRAAPTLRATTEEEITELEQNGFKIWLLATN